MNTLKNITFIFNDIVGGVATMNIKIMQQADLLQHFNVTIILVNNKSNKSQNILVNKLDKRIQILHFDFDKFDNYHFILKNLHKLLESKLGILITNDGIELDSIKLFGTRQVVYHIVHDLYNFKLAVTSRETIDFFICHTQECFRLLNSDPNLRGNAFYLPFGVQVNNSSIKENMYQKLIIISLSRLVKSKGIYHLIDIENYLALQNIEVEWLIVGDGPERDFIQSQWSKKNNVSFHAPADESGVVQLLKKSDIFISLSEFEGYGISLLEAMSYGLVPIITKLPIGIHSLIDNSIGFCLDEVKINLIGDFIFKLNNDRLLLNHYKKNSLEFVLNGFNSQSTGTKYLETFNQNRVKRTSGKQTKHISQFGLFDNKQLPNTTSRFFKKLKHAIS